MPRFNAPFYGPAPGPHTPGPDGYLPNSPAGLVFGPFDVPLPNQIQLTTTVLTFTRPDGGIISSNTTVNIGNGYVWQGPGGDSIIYWQFSPGILNQSGTWQVTITDSTVGGPIIKGTFKVAPGSPLDERAKQLSDHKILTFDDSSSLYTLASPSTFYTTPPFTLGDAWSDMTIAVNDGEPGLIALWDFDVYAGFFYPDNPEPDTYDGYRGGVLIMFPGQNDPSVLPILSYTAAPVDEGATWTQAWSGAISTSGILVACIAYCGFTDVQNMYPRISRDFGQTWADITGLPASLGTLQNAGYGQQWTKVCFGQNAKVMYIHRTGDYIYKSMDSGVTWNALTSGPTFPATHGNRAPYSGSGSIRLRCSQDGSVIAGIDWGGQFWVSKDGGTTWSHTDFYVLCGSVPLITTEFVGITDFGMPIDGSKFLVTIGLAPNYGAVWSSTDGINWTERTVKLPSINSTTAISAIQAAPTYCCVSPNGENAVVSYSPVSSDNTKFSTDASYAGPWHADRGTWIQQPVTVNLDTGGRVVATYIVPA